MKGVIKLLKIKLIEKCYRNFFELLHFQMPQIIPDQF